MNKKVTVLLTALVVCSFILPTSYVNAKSENVKKSNVSTSNSSAKEKAKDTKQEQDKEKIEKDKGKVEKDKEKDKKDEIKSEKSKGKKDNQDKHLNNMMRVIFNRLDSIEEETSKIEEQINKYFKTETSTTNSSGENNTSKEINEDEKIEEATESEVSEEGKIADELDKDITEEEQEELEDVEKEFTIQDNGKYNSFYGKLNAQLNKLDSVVNKLDSLSKRYGEDNEALVDAYSKVEEMKEMINLLISDLDAKQDKVVQAIREEKNKKVIEQKKKVAENKNWQITFSKELDPKTVTGENIVVSDAQGNIVAVQISYNSESKQVSIQSAEGFELGKTYYLNISTNVKSAEGNNLSEAIEMGFTIG